MSPWTAVLIAWVLPVGIAYTIGRGRDRGAAGLLLGLLLSWVGVVIALFLTQGGISCPACREKVKDGAVVCRHCGSTLEYVGKGLRARIRATPPA